MLPKSLFSFSFSFFLHNVDCLNSFWCRSLLIHRPEKLLAVRIVWTYCDLFTLLWEHLAKKKSKLNQSNDFQHWCSRSFMCSNWEFERHFDCRDQNQAFHCCPHDSRDLIEVFFGFFSPLPQPVRKLCSWSDSQHDPSDVASPAVRWECGIYRI